MVSRPIVVQSLWLLCLRTAEPVSSSRKVSSPSGIMPPNLSGDTIPASTSSNVLSSFQFIIVSFALVTSSRDFVTALRPT